MLRFEAVTRLYGSTRALDAVSFRLEPGTLTALVGENGAGKTTLLRVAATLEPPSSGRVTVGGATDEGARRLLAWLGQEPGLYEDLTLRENLLFAARAFGQAPPSAVEGAASALGIAPKLEARVRHLSRGERQRGALARALLGGPMMLLDEPTTALDAEGARLLQELLASLRGERTMLVATHDAELVKRADRVLRLDAGRLAA